MAEAGIIITLPSPKKQEHETESKKEPKEVPVPGKLLLLPTIVTIGIVSAILDNGFGTQSSVGKFSSGEALIPSMRLMSPVPELLPRAQNDQC